MANHLLRQFRDGAKTALTGLTLNAVTINPFVNRAPEQQFQDAELPAFRIHVGPDEAQISSLGVTRVYERHAVLLVEGCQKKRSTFQDDALELCRLVEVNLTSLTGAKAVDIRHIEFDEEAHGEIPVIVARMRFEVLYYTQIGAPDVAL